MVVLALSSATPEEGVVLSFSLSQDLLTTDTEEIASATAITPKIPSALCVLFII